ncbi:MFS transporter, partial [Gardnerella vaginalis]
LFNLGCVLGGFLFTWILRYVKGTLVLLMNCIGSFIAILAAMLVNTALSYYIGLFVAGLFLGVLFSVIVAIASRIMYKRVSIACSIVATASGVADMLTPIVVGAVISQFGVGFSYTFGLIMLAICIASAALLKIVTFEDTVSIN